MRPVRQTAFGYPHGNCMAACVASLLELPIEEMPVIPADANFNETWDAWLRDRGFARICFHSDGTNFIPKGYYLLAGPSPRPIVDENGVRAFHVVVGLDGKPVHDPHPDDTFLDSITEVEILYPLDPSMAVTR
jgi:hypothetical protein